MKRILIIALPITLAFSFLLFSCIKRISSEPTTYEEQERIIESFFKSFMIQDYEGMKQFCTAECVENYFHNNDVFGLERAELISFQRDDIIIRDDEYWFSVHLKVTPSPKSSIYPSETTDLYMVLINSDNKWIITRFDTG